MTWGGDRSWLSQKDLGRDKEKGLLWGQKSYTVKRAEKSQVASPPAVPSQFYPGWSLGHLCMNQKKAPRGLGPAPAVHSCAPAGSPLWRSALCRLQRQAGPSLLSFDGFLTAGLSLGDLDRL